MPLDTNSSSSVLKNQAFSVFASQEMIESLGRRTEDGQTQNSTDVNMVENNALAFHTKTHTHTPPAPPTPQNEGLALKAPASPPQVQPADSLHLIDTYRQHKSVLFHGKTFRFRSNNPHNKNNVYVNTLLRSSAQIFPRGEEGGSPHAPLRYSTAS